MRSTIRDLAIVVAGVLIAAALVSAAQSLVGWVAPELARTGL